MASGSPLTTMHAFFPWKVPRWSEGLEAWNGDQLPRT
jgi:hypothetical protein